MPTKIKQQRRQQAQAKRTRSTLRSMAETALRTQLVHTKRMKDIDDDYGLWRWLDSLNTPTEDARSKWERELQDRLGEELGLHSDD